MKTSQKLKNVTIFLGILLASGTMLSFSGCGKEAEKAEQSAAAGPMIFPAGTLIISESEREIREELPGRVDAIRNAEIRSRATGIVNKITFKEGDFVKAGQVLFEIDPDELQAALDKAKANLEAAKVQLESAEILFKRYSSLVKNGGVSQQNYDDSRIAVESAKANIVGCEAAVKTAEINLSYAKVVSPIDGVIGEAIVTEGALVSASQATLLAIVQQMDPVYFDFSQSGRKQLELRRAVKEGRAEQINGVVPVKLLLEDGTEYSETGTLKFSDVSVDESTGMFKLRAEFANPEHLLLPGMFARAVIVQGVDKKAILVPQKSVIRGTAGKANVFILNKDRIVENRSITAAEMDGNGNWIVTEGLEAGDEIVADSLTQIGIMISKGAIRIPSKEELAQMQKAAGTPESAGTPEAAGTPESAGTPEAAGTPESAETK